jgi:hypothetical protein
MTTVQRAATDVTRHRPPERQGDRPADGGAARSGRAITFEQRDWMLFLDRFSSRNVGRTATLEIEDATFGSQRVASGRRLVGIVYDWRGERLDIMLGEAERTDHHLTHSVTDVVGLEVLRSAGRDEVLCIEHPAARTLLLLGS